MKTSELTGPALDWAVAKAEGHEVAVATGTGLIIIRRGNVVDYFDPSTNWGWGGPIIERESISVQRFDGNAKGTRAWNAYVNEPPLKHDEEICGPTALIATMRCFVASKLGDEVDVPKELQ